MSAIKDITDLTIQLLNSKKGREFAAEIAKIQVLAATVVSEQAAIVEKYTEAQLENVRLAKRNAELEAQLASSKRDPGDDAMCRAMEP